MNEKIARMMKEVERRGGIVGGVGAIPDEVAEAFLAEVLDCPDCRAAAAAMGFDVTGPPLPPAAHDH